MQPARAVAAKWHRDGIGTDRSLQYEYLNNVSNMYLTQEERQALRDASADGIDAISQLLTWLIQTNPQAFHTAQTLSARMFYHEPAAYVPRSGFVDSIASGRTARALTEQSGRKAEVVYGLMAPLR
ncbi:hypothetical protein SAMN05444172_9032 [Burkholderia sp. GAS332]|nr:hypothetical protein SAMN05444172_9032 [Burkholderia sp. GAS332]